MIEDKLIQAFKEAGIEYKLITLPETPEDKKRNKEVRKYIMGIEKAYKNAKKKKSNIIYKEYSTNTYSPFLAPTN